MIDPEKLAAFAVVSATTSLIPGPSMLFIMGQAVRRGGRSGAAALAGVQLGYVWWWFLAALGLGTLATAFPLAFHVLAIAGALYLAWLGVQAIRHAGEVEGARSGSRKPSKRAFRDGVIVAMSNPKSLVYIVALLPPFVDSQSAVVPQIVVLAVLAMVIDVALGTIYIVAGNRLAQAMTRPRTRVRVDRSIGAIYLAIAAAILTDMFY
jgi:threonine/homoserine/homoserine lactone efflux protein